MHYIVRTVRLICHYLFRKQIRRYSVGKRRNFIASDTKPTQPPQLRVRSPSCIPLYISNVRGLEGTVTRRPRNSISARGERGDGNWKLSRSRARSSPTLFVLHATDTHACAISQRALPPPRPVPIKINKCILPHVSAY